MDQDKAKQGPVKRKAYKKLSETYLRNSALYYLQRHPTSVAHFLTVMDRKMARSLKSHPGQDVDSFKAYLREKLVPEFTRAGFLNDELYAKALTGSLRRRGLPKRTIAMKLKMKGLDLPAAAEDDPSDLDAAVIFARRKKLGPYARKQRDPQKDLAAMARAGFSYDVCKKVIGARSASDFDD